MLNRSRENLAEYLAYEQEVDQAAARVNERWGTRDWQPVVVDTRDDYEQTIAGFTRYDVLLVNPVKDGLNLVAKEGPLREPARRRACVLSPEAGAYDELHDAVVAGPPLRHRTGRARAAPTRSTMPSDERAARAKTPARARGGPHAADLARRAAQPGPAEPVVEPSIASASASSSAASPAGPVDHDVGVAHLGRALVRRDADAHRVRRARRRRPSAWSAAKAGRSPASSPANAADRASRARARRRCALVDRDRRPQLHRHPAA